MISSDPSVELYGVGYLPDPDLANLEVNRKAFPCRPTAKDPITITYDKLARTVEFVSKDFRFSQSNLPQKDFAISICLWMAQQETRVRILKVW